MNATKEWKEYHASVCAINHFGSSGSMEKNGAVEMFLRSVEKHKFKYSEYIGDLLTKWLTVSKYTTIMLYEIIKEIKRKI